MTVPRAGTRFQRHRDDTRRDEKCRSFSYCRRRDRQLADGTGAPRGRARRPL